MNEKLPPYLEIALKIDSDEFYNMILSMIKSANSLPKTFTEIDVPQLISISAHSRDRKLGTASVWVKSNPELFKNADSPRADFLRLIDSIQRALLLINRSILGDILVAINPDCRKPLKAISSNCSPQRLLVYGKSTENRAIVSTVKEFTEANQHVVNMYFPYFDFRRVASLNGIVYVIGGVDEEHTWLPTVTVINTETGVVSDGQPMLTPRSSGAVAKSTDEIFVCGGWNNQVILRSCERLRPATSLDWSEMPSLTEKRWAAAAVVFGNRGVDKQLLVTGGYANRTSLASVELLNLQQNSNWITVAPMRGSRNRHGICFYRERVLVAGGWANGAKLDSVEMFSPPRATGDPGQWTQMQPLTQILGWVSLTVWKDRLLAFGLSDYQIEELIDQRRYDSTNNQTEEMLPHFKWRPVSDFPENLETVEGVVVVQRHTNVSA